METTKILNVITVYYLIPLYIVYATLGLIDSITGF